MVLTYHPQQHVVIFITVPSFRGYTAEELSLPLFSDKYINPRDTTHKSRTAKEWYDFLLKQGHEVEQALGKALGYPPLYPIVTQVDDGTVCVGEHVPETLAHEAARVLRRLRKVADVAYASLFGKRRCYDYKRTELVDVLNNFRADFPGLTSTWVDEDAPRGGE